MLRLYKWQITEFGQLKKRQKLQFEHTNLNTFLPSDFFYSSWATEKYFSITEKHFSIRDV